MKKAILLALVIFCQILLSNCSDNAVEPTIDKIDTNNENEEFDLDNCQPKAIVYDSASVPLDCYAWGLTAWPGDDAKHDYHAIQGWLQAVTLDSKANADSSGLIEIEYVALVGKDRVTKLDSVVAVFNYNDKPRSLTTNEGGLFSRWYVDNSFSAMSNSLIADGRLKIWPSLFPNRVSHWWLNSTGKYPREANKDYRLICRLRISGNIAVQLAADYYKEISSNYPDNTEAWHSSWLGQTNGKFVTICYPE